jgi:hypothetical protein
MAEVAAVPTQTVLPAACPACRFVFGPADVSTMTAHFLAHLVMQMAPGGNRESTSDW